MSNSVYRFLYDIETAIISKKEYECHQPNKTAPSFWIETEPNGELKAFNRADVEVNNNIKIIDHNGGKAVEFYTFESDEAKVLDIIHKHIESVMSDMKRHMDEIREQYDSLSDVLSSLERTKERLEEKLSEEEAER